MVEPHLESFSSEYAIVHNAEVRTWGEGMAHMDSGLYESISDHLGEPIIGFTGGLHYQFIPSTDVLSGQCAIPDTDTKSDPSSLLVRK